MTTLLTVKYDNYKKWCVASLIASSAFTIMGPQVNVKGLFLKNVDTVFCNLNHCFLNIKTQLQVEKFNQKLKLLT